MFVSYSSFFEQVDVFFLFTKKGIIPTTIVVRVAMGGTSGNQTSSVESNMEFAFTDGTLSGSTKRNWNARLSRTEPKRTGTQLICTDRQSA